MTEKSKRFTWAPTQPGWKISDNEFIPFEEMTPAQMKKYYRLAQHKEIHYANKSYVFADKAEEIEKIAKERGIDLKSIDTEYHNNKRKFKSV